MYYYEIYNKKGELIDTIYTDWELEKYAAYPEIYDIKYRRMDMGD